MLKSVTRSGTPFYHLAEWTNPQQSPPPLFLLCFLPSSHFGIPQRMVPSYTSLLVADACALTPPRDPRIQPLCKMAQGPQEGRARPPHGGPRGPLSPINGYVSTEEHPYIHTHVDAWHRSCGIKPVPLKVWPKQLVVWCMCVRCSSMHKVTRAHPCRFVELKCLCHVFAFRFRLHARPHYTQRGQGGGTSGGSRGRQT